MEKILGERLLSWQMREEAKGGTAVQSEEVRTAPGGPDGPSLVEGLEP